MHNPLIRAPQATDLSAPVGLVMRPTLTVDAVDSLARAAQTMRENGGTILPVLDDQGRLTGVLTDVGLARALLEMSEPTDAVGLFAERAETLSPYATAAEALRRGGDGKTRVVVDDAGRPVGLVSALDLWPRRRTLPRPAMVGGMATPFGVYLTTGNVSAGAPWWALMTTGAAMMAMLTVGTGVSAFAMEHGMMPALAPYLIGLVFFAAMRFLPLSGTHGAEHQVVHAIEREETLAPEVVSRMPLVHPRCGTNLMVGMAIFSSILFTPWVKDMEIRFLPALLLAVVLAVPVGSLAQRFVTTRRPNERQLAGAIRAGEALLQANATARLSRPSPLRRIWSMGLLQVMAGATLLAAILGLVKSATSLAWLPSLH